LTDVLFWIAIGALLVALVYMQVRGMRALQAWGVQPSRAVVTLRAVNVLLAVAAVAFMFWAWVR